MHKGGGVPTRELDSNLSDFRTRIALVVSSSHLPKTPETISEIRDHDTTSYQGLVSLIVTLDLSLYT